MMASSSSSGNNLSLLLPAETVIRLIDSIQRLTTSVEELQRTIASGQKLPSSDSVSIDHFTDTDDGTVQSPWTRIRVLKDHDIAMEEKKDIQYVKVIIESSSNEQRLDPWKSLYFIDWRYRFQMGWASETERPQHGGPLVPNIIRYYSENVEERLSLQKLLYFGLSRWWWHHGKPSSDELPRIRGTLDMGPLVSLIGMRLPGTPNIPITSPSGAHLVVQVLVEMLRMSAPRDASESLPLWKSGEGQFWAKKATLGDLLDRCYQRKVLQQPEEEDLKTHVLHATYTMNAIGLVDFWGSVGYSAMTRVTSVDELRSLRLSDVWWRTQIDDEEPPPFAKSTASSFRSRDFCTETIRKVGKLKIEWTPSLSHHLELNVELSTLKVFWFGFAVKAAPIFHIGCSPYRFTYCHLTNPSWSPLFDELQLTYSLLFRSQNDNCAANIAEYSSLPIPEWLRVLYGDEKGPLTDKLASNMSYFTSMKRPWLSDIESHIEDLNEAIPHIQTFDRYKVFGDRLGMLKAYLDSQSPGGIRGLWIDNRDSLAWYTFWAIIFVGGMGIFLSFLSLLVTIAQTVATFRGLYAAANNAG